MRPHRPTAVLLLLALAALLTASCASPQDEPGARTASPTVSATASGTPSAAPSATASGGAAMTISGFAYVVPASVRPGEQVTVVNRDREAHTVTVDEGAIRLTVLPGATAVFAAPADVGAHTVTCDLHGGMDAVLVVA